MSLQIWLEEGRLRPHQTNKREIKELLPVAERDLSDAKVPDLSTDRRFLIAYEAALTLPRFPSTPRVMKPTAAVTTGLPFKRCQRSWARGSLTWPSI